MGQRLKYRVELLQHIYTAQVDMLQGTPGSRATPTGGAVSTTNASGMTWSPLSATEMKALSTSLSKPHKTTTDVNE